MERFAELMQRLLEVHGGERRSAELIEEDARLMDRLKRRKLGGQPRRAVRLSQDSRVGQRFRT
jgi:hypothetical protein